MMLRRTAVLCSAVLLTTTTMLGSEAWTQEPDGFAGVPFGTPITEALPALKVPPTFCKQVDPARSRGVRTVCNHASYAITDAVKVIASFKFVKGDGEEPEFNGVVLEITNRRFSDVKQLLFTKYGPPHVFDNKTRTDWVFTGAQWQDQQYGWYGDRVRIFINETPQPLARSKVTIERGAGPEAKSGDEKRKSAFD
jgi:hypothetical protein